MRSRRRLNNKISILKSSLNIIILISITSLLSYPSLFWYLSILGGIILMIGALFKMPRLIILGIVTSAGSYYLSSLGKSLSFINVTLFIVMFLFFYASIVYLNEVIRRDIIRNNYKGDTGSVLDEYVKHWRRSALKGFSIAYVLAFFAYFVSRMGTFNFWNQLDKTILTVFSVILVFCILILLYFLFVRLPEIYLGKD